MNAAPTELRPGAWRLPLPLGGHSVGHVNAYAFVDPADGVLLVDTGWDVAGTWEALVTLLERVDATVRDVRGVLLTHVHADHCGLARRLQRDTGAWVAMHQRDAGDVRERYGDADGFLAATAAWLERAGVPAALREGARAHARASVDLAEPFDADIALADGDVVAHGDWRLTTVHTPGHTAGHACFHEPAAGLLVSGDHVLPRIRVSATFRPQSPADPIEGYLASLEVLGALDVTQVLPGHQRPFEDLGERLATLEAYHERRLREVASIVERHPATVWEVCARVRRSRRWDELRPSAQIVAVGETYAHLRRLAALGELEATERSPARWSSTR